MTIVDLSVPLEASPSEPVRPQVDFEDHDRSAPLVAGIFGCEVSQLPDGKGWASETVTAITHAGTHVDAPYHYFPTCGGERARTIDELPLEWFLAPGVVIDATDRADGEALTAADLEERVPRELQELDIVLVHTGRDEFYGQPDYIARGPGVSAEGTRWLYERGVRVMGIDAWGWDSPLHLQAERARAERRPGIFWEAHQCGLAYSQIERLVNLAALPPHGFTVSCFPLRLVGGSAAPARVVAEVP